MSKTKKIRKNDESSDESDDSSTSEPSTSDSSSDESSRKRKHKKKSKKVKKHKSKKKNSDSEDESSSSGGEVVKRKKHKKHKKRRKHQDSDSDVKIQETDKILYISSGDEDKHRHHKRDKRLEELKRLRGPGRDEGKDVKSKWDSPADEKELDRKRSDFNSYHSKDKYNRSDDIKIKEDKYGRRDDDYRKTDDRKDDGRRRHDDNHDNRHHDNEHRRHDDDYKANDDFRPRTYEDRRHNNFDHGWKNNDFDRPPQGGRDNHFNFRGRNNYNRPFNDRQNNFNRRPFFNNNDQRNDNFNRRPFFNDNNHFNNRDNDGGGAAPNRRNPFDRKFNDNQRFDRVSMERNQQDERPWRDNRERNDDRPDRQIPPLFRRDNNNGGGGRFFDNNRRFEDRKERDDRPHLDRQSEPRDANHFHKYSPKRNSQRADKRSSQRESRQHSEKVTTPRDKLPRPEKRSRSDKLSPKLEDDTDKHRDKKRSDSQQQSPKHSDWERSRSRSVIKSERVHKPKDSNKYEWGKRSVKSEDKSSKATVEKEKPNFGLSGKLTEDTNKVNGVVIRYAEPSEARKPQRRWRLYPFKGALSLHTMYIHRQSCYLIGRDRKVCDLPVDHPSCSKQHAALQYRLVPYKKDDGTVSKRVRPYVLDMDSANGTYVNNKKIEPKKYMELFEKDVIKFGFSSREYVLLHENSKDDALDDDILVDEVAIKSESAE